MKAMIPVTSGAGLEELPLGAGRKFLQEQLGQADAVDRVRSEGIACEHYYYRNIDMTFTFSAKEGDRLLVITTANPCYLLDKKIRTGMSRENVLNIAGALYPGKPETETEEENGNDPAVLYSYPGSGVDLWIGNGRLIYFQVSPPLGTDDIRIWPER